MDYLELLTIFNIVIIVLIGLFILNWINNLDKIKCECSNTNKKVFIKAWWFFLILYYSSILIIYVLTNNNQSLSDFIQFNNIILSMNLIIGIVAVIMVIITYNYINNLKKNNCNCSLSKSQELLFLYSKINIAIIVIVIIIFILFLIYYVYI
jgi:hypothetical protein